MNEERQTEGIDISSFFGFVRRRWLIIVAATVVGGAAAFLLSSSKSDVYEGTATMLLRGVSSQDRSSSFAPPVPDAATDREALALAQPVKDRTVKALTKELGENGAQAAVDRVDAASAAETEALRIIAKAPNGPEAALVANAYARAFLEFRRDEAIRAIRRALTAAERDLARLRRAEDRSGETPPDLFAAISGATQNIAGLRQSLATQEGGGVILKPASVPASPASPKPGRDAIIGFFAGLLIGLAIALVREQLDRRLKGSKDLEEVFGLPVLANVPRSRALANSNSRALDQLPAVESEAFQLLRANLHFLEGSHDLKSVVVTSPGIGDGKSTVSLNLAKADASVGRKVLLIEADMRRPRLGKLLGVQSEQGLSTYLAHPEQDLVDACHRVPVAHRTNGTSQPLTMDVMMSGPEPSNPSELINSPRMTALLDEAEELYDLVVIDTSPAGVVADAIPLMSRASAVVVVGRVGRITSGEANTLREQLERIGAPAFGLVANFAKSPGQYAYY